MESTDSSSGSQQQPQLPPGFRFHPTDEELVVHYLKKKAAAAPLPVAIIADVDLYKFDPWELPAKAIFGEQEWYFFSPRDRKYPNGTRPNRAATSGYWKATGTDKPVLTAGGTQRVGVKKALVFYGGKPPKGIKTNWIMHEYRLIDSTKSTSKPPDFANKKASLRLDDWVLCRIYKKNNAQRPLEQEQDIHHHHHHNHHAHDMMNVGTSIQSTISMPHMGRRQQQHQNMYHEGMMMTHDAMNSVQLGSPASNHLMAQNLLPTMRTLISNLYYNDERNANDISPPMKRFLPENCSSGRTDETTASSMAAILGQLPQTAPMLVGNNLGDHQGVFEQQQYQVSGMNNWYA